MEPAIERQLPRVDAGVLEKQEVGSLMKQLTAKKCKGFKKAWIGSSGTLGKLPVGWAGLEHDPYHGSCCHDRAGLPAPAARLQWMASHCPTAHLGQWCLSGDAESKLQNGKEKEQIANGVCGG